MFHLIISVTIIVNVVISDNNNNNNNNNVEPTKYLYNTI